MNMPLKPIKTLALFVFLISSSAFAQSMTKSCNGFMRYCDEYGICSDEYFYLYAYQYVKFSRGQLDRYRYRFNFRGYLLGEEDDYTYSGLYTNSHLIYAGPNFDLAIPWNELESIYKIDHQTGMWEVICQ